MEHSELINKIKTQEEQAKKLIEDAKIKSAEMIYDARTNRKSQLLNQAKQDAQVTCDSIKVEFESKIKSSISEIEVTSNKAISQIKSTAEKNKTAATDFIVEEILNQWLSQN